MTFFVRFMGFTHLRYGFCQGCVCTCEALDKNKTRHNEKCGVCRLLSSTLPCRATQHQRTEPHRQHLPSTKNTGRQTASKGEARSRPKQGNALPCEAEAPQRGEDLSRGVCPLMVVSYAVTFCRAANRRGNLGKGDTERARENQGGKPRAGGLPCIRHSVTHSNFIKTQGIRLTEALTAGGIRPLAAKASRKGRSLYRGNEHDRVYMSLSLIRQ